MAKKSAIYMVYYGQEYRVLEQRSVMKNILVMCLLLLGILLLNTGCQSMFPTDQARTVNRWTNYDETQVTFGKIVPNQTTVEELKGLGLDPHSSPNIKVLTYLDVIARFIPNQSITKDD